MNLSGQKYTPLDGSLKVYEPHKMVWTPTDDGVVAPFYLPSKTQQVNVKACLSGSTQCCWYQLLKVHLWQQKGSQSVAGGRGFSYGCFLIICVAPQRCFKVWLGTFKVYRWMWSPIPILGNKQGWDFGEIQGKKTTNNEKARAVINMEMTSWAYLVGWNPMLHVPFGNLNFSKGW